MVMDVRMLMPNFVLTNFVAGTSGERMSHHPHYCTPASRRFCSDVKRLGLNVMTLQPRCNDVETKAGVAVTVTAVAQLKVCDASPSCVSFATASTMISIRHFGID